MAKALVISELIRNFAVDITSSKDIIMVSAAFKNRTRDEIIAAVRESLRKKQEWIKQSDEEFKRIREERRKLAL
jgi:hypothetical protein